MTAHPIRISHLITSLDQNGAQNALRRIVERLPQERFTSSIISLAPRHPETDVPFPDHVDVASLNMRPSFPNPMALLKLRRLLRRQEPNVLQTWLYHADLLGTLVGFFTNTGTLLWNIRCTDMGEEYQAGLKHMMIRRLASWSARPNAIVVNSMAGQRDHEKLGYRPRQWVNIPNGFDLDTLRPDQALRAQSRSTLGVETNDTLLIGVAGRFHRMKGFDTFLTAASMCQQPGLKFVLFGSGDPTETAALRELANRLGLSESIIWAGHWSNITAALNALDIFVAPSIFGEGFPNVIAEAMACALPCVVTNVGESAHIAGNTNDVVPPKDARALAAAIDRLAGLSQDQRRETGMKGRARIGRNFSIEDITDRYAKFYEQCAAESRSNAAVV